MGVDSDVPLEEREKAGSQGPGCRRCGGAEFEEALRVAFSLLPLYQKVEPSEWRKACRVSANGCKELGRLFHSFHSSGIGCPGLQWGAIEHDTNFSKGCGSAASKCSTSSGLVGGGKCLNGGDVDVRGARMKRA